MLFRRSPLGGRALILPSPLCGRGGLCGVLGAEAEGGRISPLSSIICAGEFVSSEEALNMLSLREKEEGLAACSVSGISSASAEVTSPA